MENLPEIQVLNQSGSGTESKITVTLYQLVNWCKINIALATIIIITGIFSVNLPNSFGLYTSAITKLAHCFWVGGLTVVFSLYGILAYRNKEFSELKASIHVAIASINIMAIIGGFVVLAFNLETVINLPHKPNKDGTESTVIDVVTVQVISVLVSAIVMIIYTLFLYGNVKSVRMHHYVPRNLLSRPEHDFSHTMVRKKTYSVPLDGLSS
ncbi:hypothetical protein TrispH2_009451 [Trichoplax sp. H2]|nr:hypothetical protein TrispH2_009451 [Trichoplax sp. H2]|eukprot:RDD38858.1 hypothetical protein TrispH2_009451 [Trichoplax sp. H2]